MTCDTVRKPGIRRGCDCRRRGAGDGGAGRIAPSWAGRSCASASGDHDRSDSGRSPHPSSPAAPSRGSSPPSPGRPRAADQDPTVTRVGGRRLAPLPDDAAATASGAMRWMTTLSIRLRSSAFFCSCEKRPARHHSGIVSPGLGEAPAGSRGRVPEVGPIAARCPSSRSSSACFSSRRAALPSPSPARRPPGGCRGRPWLELALGQPGLVAEPLELLPPRCWTSPPRPPRRAWPWPRRRRPAPPGARASKKSRHDVVVDRIGGQAGRPGPALLAEVVAHVVGPALVLHDHLVAALAAVDDAVEQGLARPGDAAGLVAVVLAVVVAEHGLDPLECGPVDVGRILVPDENLHSAIGRRLLQAPGGRPGRAHGPGAAVDERAGIGRVLQDGQTAETVGAAPDQVAEAVPSGQDKPWSLKDRTTGDAADSEEGGEDESDPVLDLVVGMLDDTPRGRRASGRPAGSAPVRRAAPC